MVTSVLVDANVLSSRTLRDWLFLLRNESRLNVFVVWASEDIITEVTFHFRKNNPLFESAKIERLRARLFKQPDDLVSDFEVDIPSPIKDPGDAHVHAAAVASGADVLLTSDSDFLDLPQEDLDSLPYEVITPDDFFVTIHAASPDCVQRVVQLQKNYWLGRVGSADLPHYLNKAGCPSFAELVRLELTGIHRP